jgi:hypothetical protein
MKEYIRVIGESGVYIFTKREIEKALDRENGGVNGRLYNEDDERICRICKTKEDDDGRCNCTNNN